MPHSLLNITACWYNLLLSSSYLPNLPNFLNEYERNSFPTQNVTIKLRQHKLTPTQWIPRQKKLGNVSSTSSNLRHSIQPTLYIHCITKSYHIDTTSGLFLPFCFLIRPGTNHLRQNVEMWKVIVDPNMTRMENHATVCHLGTKAIDAYLTHHAG